MWFEVLKPPFFFFSFFCLRWFYIAVFVYKTDAQVIKIRRQVFLRLLSICLRNYSFCSKCLFTFGKEMLFSIIPTWTTVCLSGQRLGLLTSAHTAVPFLIQSTVLASSTSSRLRIYLVNGFLNAGFSAFWFVI